MMIEIPDRILKASSEQEVCLAVAFALFEERLLSLASAARVAGFSKAEFHAALLQRQETSSFADQQTATADGVLTQAQKTLKSGFDFDQILAEQRYEGPDRQSLKQSIKELDVQESVEEMLASLNS
jgi:predicted HTH domain antitoxin